MRLSELAQALGAELVAGSNRGLVEAGAIEVRGVAGLEQAQGDQLSFLDNPRYTGAANRTAAAAVLVEPGSPSLPVPTLRIRNPYLAFAKAVALFYDAPRYAPGIHPTAVVDATATLGENVHLGPYVVVGPRVVIGRDSILLAHTVVYEGASVGARFFAHAHAVVREHSLLGDDVILGNGVVVGSDGFGFAKEGTGSWFKIPQSGRTVIGNGVEIQANSCIDRASVGETRVEPGVKIDNLVQVGHGSSVGENTLLCSQVGLAGSSHLGKNVILAGQVGVAGHLSVGDGVIATAQSGIPNDVAAGEMVSGYPAMPNRQWLRAAAGFGRLPEILRRLQKLERFLAEPEESLHQK